MKILVHKKMVVATIGVNNKKDLSMKNISLIILLISLVFNSIAQSAEFGYSEECSIWETTDFVIRDYNITIDKNNTMHMVYSTDISSNFGKIYYIKSIDLGVTWTNPIDISNNQEKWTLDPHIAADNENNLYVTFSYDVGDYTNTKVVFKNLMVKIGVLEIQ